MRALALEYFGWELATEGDAFLLAFHDCFDAISFALTFQDALMDEVSCIQDGSDGRDSYFTLRCATIVLNLCLCRREVFYVHSSHAS